MKKFSLKVEPGSEVGLISPPYFLKHLLTGFILFVSVRWKPLYHLSFLANTSRGDPSCNLGSILATFIRISPILRWSVQSKRPLIILFYFFLVVVVVNIVLDCYRWSNIFFPSLYIICVLFYLTSEKIERQMYLSLILSCLRHAYMELFAYEVCSGLVYFVCMGWD